MITVDPNPKSDIINQGNIIFQARKKSLNQSHESEAVCTYDTYSLTDQQMV